MPAFRNGNLMNRKLGGWVRETTLDLILSWCLKQLQPHQSSKQSTKVSLLCQQNLSFSASLLLLLQGKRKLKACLCLILCHRDSLLLPKGLLIIFPRNTLYKQHNSPQLLRLPLFLIVLVLVANEVRAKKSKYGKTFS